MFRRCHWIVWLMLALLPLRGLAASVMQPVAMAVTAGSPAEHSAAADALAHPCHDAPAADDAPTAAHACHLCDLCHSAVATAPARAVLGHAAPGAARPDHPWHDIGRLATGGLERPPRHDLA